MYVGYRGDVTHGAMLMTRVGAVTCAFPIEQVVETMRPLAIEPIGRSRDPALALVDGISMIRGAPVAVIDARRLLGVSGESTSRLVVVRAADHQIAILVDAVIEVRQVERDSLARLPALLTGVTASAITAIGARDSGLMVVLDAARVLPEAAQALIAEATAPAPSEEAAGDARHDDGAHGGAP